jgi:hypothetical protein
MINLNMKIIDEGDHTIINKQIETFKYKIVNTGDGLILKSIEINSKDIYELNEKTRYNIVDSEKENYEKDLANIKAIDFIEKVYIILEKTTKHNLRNTYIINFLKIEGNNQNVGQNLIFKNKLQSLD